MNKPVKYEDGQLFGLDIGGGVSLILVGLFFCLFFFGSSCFQPIGYIGLLLITIPLSIWCFRYIYYLIKLREYKNR